VVIVIYYNNESEDKIMDIYESKFMPERMSDNRNDEWSMSVYFGNDHRPKIHYYSNAYKLNISFYNGYSKSISKYKDRIACYGQYRGLSDLMKDYILYHRYYDKDGRIITKVLPDACFDLIVNTWYR
jgi:hypothetical protein